MENPEHVSISLPIFPLFTFSIAGMVRTEYDTSSSKDMALRTSLLFRLAKQLKWLSDTFHICVVVINQVENLDYFFKFVCHERRNVLYTYLIHMLLHLIIFVRADNMLNFYSIIVIR